MYDHRKIPGVEWRLLAEIVSLVEHRMKLEALRVENR